MNEQLIYEKQFLHNTNHTFEIDNIRLFYKYNLALYNKKKT